MSSTKNYIQCEKVIGMHTLFSKDTDDLYYRTLTGPDAPFVSDAIAYDYLMSGLKRNGSVYTVVGAETTLKVLYGPAVGWPMPDNVIDT